MWVGADPQRIIDDHARAYPVSRPDRVLEPLYPDRLGEDLIASLLPGNPTEAEDGITIAADPQAVDVLDRLLDGDKAVPAAHIPALIVLVEVARRWPHIAELLASRLDRRGELLVECGGTVVARAAPIPGLGPVLPEIGERLDRIIGTGTHLTLDPAAVAVQHELVDHARSGTDIATLARQLTIVAVRLAADGRRPEALDAAHEAARHYLELADMAPNVCGADVQKSESLLEWLTDQEVGSESGPVS